MCIEYNRELWSNGERQNVKEIISLIIKHTQCRDNKKELIENLMKEFSQICEEPFNMNIVFQKLICIFSKNYLIISSIFLNIIVFLCLIENIFKKTNLGMYRS